MPEWLNPRPTAATVLDRLRTTRGHRLLKGRSGLTRGKPGRHLRVVGKQLWGGLGVAQHLRHVQVGDREPVSDEVPAPGVQSRFENTERTPQACNGGIGDARVSPFL
jgi:hypothetical protein